MLKNGPSFVYVLSQKAQPRAAELILDMDIMSCQLNGETHISEVKESSQKT